MRTVKRAPVICDAHVHFFSSHFFSTLAAQKGIGREVALSSIGWDAPGSPEQLADRWRAELDAHGVSRCALIASVPGDESSVLGAIARHPTRFVGLSMFDPTAPDALERVEKALAAGLHGLCLFPAMQRYSLQDERVARLFEMAASFGRSPDAAELAPGTGDITGAAALAALAERRPVVFVHCGVLSVGVRQKLGLPSLFDIRFGNPLDLQSLAARFSSVPIIVPHFGAGLFREALMLADTCPNVYLDTSSSNRWIRYMPGLTLAQVFRSALDVIGPDRLLFGSDSSFFPRGWHRAVFDAQERAMADAAVPSEAQDKILGGNFIKLFA